MAEDLDFGSEIRVRWPRTGDSLGRMQLHWLDPEQLTDSDVAGAVAVLESSRQVDSPHQLSLTTSDFVTDVRHGFDGDPAAMAVVRGLPDGRDEPADDRGDDRAGPVTAVLEVELPHRDNTHLAMVRVTVHPAVRRRGLGARLFDIAIELALAQARTLVVVNCWDGTAGVEFAKSMGMDRASQEVKRTQNLLTVDGTRLASLASAARRHAGGYDVIRMAGRTPTEMLPDIAAMVGAINDAPTDDLDIEDMIFTPDRVEAFESAQLAHHRRLYRVVARERATGELAGHTYVGVDGQRPWHAVQFDTSVVRGHRGHRLGLLLKTEMLRWLRDVEPNLERLDTWNAASNAYMIGVNETLGYQVVAEDVGWQRHL
jgi:GNAT superfamily N-acetyltransferase